MVCCVVQGCKNTTNRKTNSAKVSFHGFPKDPIIAALWIKKLRLNRREKCWKPTVFTKICSIHFDDKVKYTTKRGFITILQGSVPTKGLHLDFLEESQPGNKGLQDPHELDPPLVSREDTDLELILDSPMKSALRRQLRKKAVLLLKHKQKIRALQQKICRLTKKNVYLQNILKDLEKKIFST